MIEKLSDGLPIYSERKEIERGEERSFFWSDSEADLVVGFLRGGVAQGAESEKFAKILAAEVVLKQGEQEKVEALLAEAKKQVVGANEDNGEVMTADQESYESMVKQATKSVLSQVERSLRSVGMLSSSDYRRRKTMGKVRDKKTFGLETNMVGYKHRSKSPVKDENGNYVRDSQVEGGYMGHEEGGPRILSAVLLPMFNLEKPMRWPRFVRGMAHEVAHEIRVWANASLWERFGWSDQLPRRGNVAAYGPQVGSNLDGSEAVGMLAGIIAEKLWGNDGEVITIEDIIPMVATRISKRNIDKSSSEDRYDKAVVALYDHLLQISEKGGEDINSLDLLALGICGYVTYEHLPELIRAGVVSQEVFAKSKLVIREIFELMCGGAYNSSMVGQENLDKTLAEVDPLGWLGDEKAKLIRERKDGFAFWQATITFGDEQSTRIAFSGDSESYFGEANGHTIYIEKPELISKLMGLDYDEEKKAWEVDSTEGRIFLVGGEVKKGGRGEYSLEDGDSWESGDDETDSPGFNTSVDSDAAEAEMKSLVEKQVKGGAQIQWLE